MANKKAKVEQEVPPEETVANQQETAEASNVESTPESESVGKSTTTDPLTDPSSNEEMKSGSTTPSSTVAEKTKKGSRRTSQVNVQHVFIIEFKSRWGRTSSVDP